MTKEKKVEKEELDKDEDEDKEEEHKPITRQIQVQKLHFNVLMSTEDSNETMDYLVSKAKEMLDRYLVD